MSPGRRKELIIKGGENIAPREIDDALYKAAGVVEAAAFARECSVYGQRVEAAVVLSSPNVHDEKELIDLCVPKLENSKPRSACILWILCPKAPQARCSD